MPLNAARSVVARPSTETTPLGSVIVTAPASPTPAALVKGTQLDAPVALSVLPLPTRSTELTPPSKKVAPSFGVFDVYR